MDYLHSGQSYVTNLRLTMLFKAENTRHKPTTLGQKIIDRFRFPILGLAYKLFPRNLGSRKILPFYLNQKKLIGDGVEIGVQRGMFSEHILTYWDGNKLTGVDPWKTFPSGGEHEPKDFVSQQIHDEFYRETQQRLSSFGQRSLLIRDTSGAASQQFEDDSLDFVFIDAQHHFDAVLEDLTLWFPKLRPGGLLAGHDWGLDYGPPLFGVEKAVREFCKKRGIEEIHLTNDKWTWFFHVPA
tara:strand:- start:31 stop:750 length:720 start_codon:yes stop_codon:yes gene_type:complete